jgi:hypothetical protein
MKLFIKHFEKSSFEKKLIKYKDLDFSLFIDYIPQSNNELSSINIFVLQEPNEYFGNHDWVIQNKNMFSFILTWSDKILNNCENAIHLAFGSPWITDEIANKKREKEFSVAHLSGKLKLTYGHAMRHEIFDRQSEIKIPKNFHATFGDRHDLPNAILGKETIFGNQMFGIVIENTSHRGYFTEKITDCMLLKTIPVYWGCSNINNFYNKDGIITFQNPDDLIKICNELTPSFYNDRINIIEENYQKVSFYKDYEGRICNKIDEIFTLNNFSN